MRDEIEKYIKPGKENIILIYILYLLGVVFMQYLFSIIGASICLYNINNSNFIWQSHYRFALNSFWLTAIALTVIWIIGIVLITNLINASFIGPLLVMVMSVLVTIWFIIRGIIAIQFLLENKEHPNPKTLWIK